MAKFLVTYHGGPGLPSDPAVRAQMLNAFGAWVAGVGDKMVDPGAPLGASKSVTSNGVTDGGSDGAGGYTVLSADSLDDAVALVSNHPFIGRGGTLRVHEAIEP